MKIKWPSLFKNNAPYFTNPSIFMEKIWTPTFFENFENSTLLPSPLYKRWGRGKGGRFQPWTEVFHITKAFFQWFTTYKQNLKRILVADLFTIYSQLHLHTGILNFGGLYFWHWQYEKEGFHEVFLPKYIPFALNRTWIIHHFSWHKVPSSKKKRAYYIFNKIKNN